jgi:hypothetical protein
MSNAFQKLSLNLWVDLSNATNISSYTANGRFLPFPTATPPLGATHTGYTATAPYTASKAWVMEVNSVPEFYCTPAGDCSGKDSQTGAPVVSHLSSGTGNQPLVWVRVNVILGPGGGQQNTFSLGNSIVGPGGPGAIRITVVIGRSHKAAGTVQQQYASPFPLGQTAGNPLCTVMDWCFPTSPSGTQPPYVQNIQNFGSDGSQVWCALGLGYPQFYSNNPGVDDNYSIVVGVTIAPASGNPVTLGHDPDFDVGM